jgi:homoserine O-acetyltransferase
MGGWVEGDPAGDRRFLDLPAPFLLERGGVLPAVRVAYETWGTLDRDGRNAVLIEHALTGDSHVVGPAGPGHPTPGWWDGLIGPGKPLDPDRFFVVCANVLGGCQGTTGPSSRAPDDGRWGSRFPEVTVGDQVRVEAAVADALGIDRWACVVGGSMGGMRALEWAVALPDRVAALFFLASGAVATADQIGTQTTQQAAIRADPRWAGGDYARDDAAGDDPARGDRARDDSARDDRARDDRARGNPPVDGLGIARRIAHLTYRSSFELGERFGRQVQDDGRYAVASYLDHHADKLARRFDAGSYVLLTEAMNSWDVGRDRGGVAAALARVTARSLVAGVDSDRLYPLALQQQVADGLGVPLRVIGSPYGHDGFLIEVGAVGALLRSLLSAD